MIILHEELKPFFTEASSFEAIMALRGDIFRAVDGRRTQRIQVGQKTYFIKQHAGVGWKEIIKNFLQLRLPIISAKNEWLALQRLTAWNIHVPEVVGFGFRGMNPAYRQSFLITRALSNHISLEHFCENWLENPPLFSLKQKLIKKVADIARTLHANGMNHRDFYICHFLLDLSAGTETDVTLYLIDLHRAQIRKRTPMRWCIKDLAGLYFSSKEVGLTKRDLLRFIKKYRNKSLRDVLHKESNFWIKVMKRGDELYRKHKK